MYWTHHFAHRETLSRAFSWLVQIGFAPDRIEAHTDGVPRLAFQVTPSELAEIEMLINAVERTDPQGWPSFWDVARQTHRYPQAETEAEAFHPHRTSSVAIGWHPAD